MGAGTTGTRLRGSRPSSGPLPVPGRDIVAASNGSTASQTGPVQWILVSVRRLAAASTTSGTSRLHLALVCPCWPRPSSGRCRFTIRCRTKCSRTAMCSMNSRTSFPLRRTPEHETTRRSHLPRSRTCRDWIWQRASYRRQTRQAVSGGRDTDIAGGRRIGRSATRPA